MSVEALAVVLHHSEATGSDKVVLMGIANHEGDGGSYPAVGTLAKYARFKGWDAKPDDDTPEAKKRAQQQRDNARRTARTACRRLEELGEVVTVTNGGTGGRSDHEKTNLYRLALSCPWYCDHSAQHRDLRDDQNANRRPPHWDQLTAMFDPRSEDSAPESGLRGPRSEDSSEPSNNHNLGNSLPQTDVERASERDQTEPPQLDPGEAMTHGAEAIRAAARKRMLEQREEASQRAAKAERSHTLPPAGKPPRYVPPARKPRPELDDPTLERIHQARDAPCPASSTGSGHQIPITEDPLCILCTRPLDQLELTP